MIALKKDNRKAVWGFCALVIAVVMVSVGVTLAAWESSGRQTNVVTIGNIEIELHDDYNEIDGTNKKPGDTVAKKVSVENTGDKPCYVRVLVKAYWDGGNATLNKFIEPNYDTTNWAGPFDWSGSDYDVCFYYKGTSGDGILQPGVTTKPLFETFQLKDGTIDGVSAEEYKGMTGHIIVKAQAVQSDNINPSEVDVANGKWPSGLYFKD